MKTKSSNYLTRGTRNVMQIVCYVICVYVLFLYLRELLLQSGNIELPALHYLEPLDTCLMLIGGLTAGMILYLAGGKTNRLVGVSMIFINILIGGGLLLKALQ